MENPSLLGDQRSNPDGLFAEGSSVGGNTATELPLLQLRACPRCDYPLIGLPPTGRCPECGREYDQISIYLYGFGTGGRASAWNQPKQTTRQLWGSGAFVVAYLAFLFAFSWWHLRAASQFFLNLLFIVPAFLIALWRKNRDEGSGAVQVKLSPLGVRQSTRGIGLIPFERADRAKWIPWKRVRNLWLRQLEPNRIRLTLRTRRDRWQFAKVLVDANLVCSKEEADFLLQRIRQWGGPAEQRR